MYNFCQFFFHIRVIKTLNCRIVTDMTDYSPNDIVDILMCLGEARGNYREAERIFGRRYPNCRCPSHVSIRFLTNRSREGFIKRKRKKKVYDNIDNLDVRLLAVLAMIHMNPHISLRNLEIELGIPRSTAHRMLKSLKYHPYHIMLHQELTDQDHVNRLFFCNWAAQKFYDDPTFFDRVLFSDEATFYNIAIVNRHNSHYWSAENPYWVRQVNHQHRWSINVWCGILGSQLIGPYIFEERLNGERYL